jgi:diguanylate cyclase (GGDEF)-like protein
MAVTVHTSIDPVTGVLPRAAMTQRLDEAIGHAERTGASMSVFLFDVDFFKTVNDVYGHLRGDLVLRQLCDVVTAAVPETDVLFRYGGDEFVLLLPETGRAGAVQLAVRVIDQVKNAQFPGEPVLHLSVSLGVASFPEDGGDQATLLACADRRNYLAKHRGRGAAVADDVDTTADADAGSSRLWERDTAVAATHDFLTRVQAAGSGALRLTGQPGAGYTRFLTEVDRLAGMRGFAVHAVGPDPDPDPIPVRPGTPILLVADCDAAPRVAQAVADLAGAAPEVLAVVYATTAGKPAPPPDLPELAVVELSPWSPATLGIWLRSVLRGEPSRTLVSWIARQSGGLPATAAAELDRLRQRHSLVPVGTGGWTVDPAVLRRSRRQVRLPAAMTRLIGREAELRELAGLVRENRLVTLVGAGGIGKTRLSLAAAAAVAEQFDDGVVFVPLDTCTNEDLVIAAIALALRVDEVPGEDLLETLLGHLGEASILLLLDNFEQALSAAPLIGEMLSAVATLQVLATSREALDLYGEQVYTVPPLPLPDISTLPAGAAGVAQARQDSPAVVLFEQRAKNAVTDFALTAETLPVVVALCRQLDGLPLAIELAAAQVDRMDPAALLEHLRQHLSTLGAGPSNRPERQQTLRGALEWSYALLDAEQQRDFAALSVFVGGCTTEAAADVAQLAGPAYGPAEPPPDQADDWQEKATRRLDLLVRKSLLAVDVQDDGGRRYRMLETIRAYATTMLASHYAAHTVHDRHAGYYAGLAERAATGLESPDQVRWVEWLERDYPNLRSAVSWALDSADVDSARRICQGLWRYWRRGSHLGEGREWLDRVLAAGDHMTANQRARLLYPAAVLAATQDDHETATRLGWQGLRLAESEQDLPTVAQARNVLGAAALAAGQYDTAAEHFRQSLAICHQTGEARGTAIAMGNLAKLSLRIGAIDEAGEYIEQCLALERAAGNSGGILLGLECQGDILLAQGRLAEARGVLAESLALSRDLGDLFGEAMALHQLASVAATEGDRPQALDRFLTAIRLRYEVEDREGLAVTLECVAEVIADGDPELGVRLLAAADVLRERHRLPVPPEQEPKRDSVLRRARIRLGDLTFTAAGQAGRVAPLELIMDQVHDLHSR